MNQAEIQWEELQIQLQQMGKVMKVRRNTRKSQSYGSDRRSVHTAIFRNRVIKDPQPPFKTKDQKEQKRENHPRCGFSSLCKKRW